jgi:hypothetical protein
MYVLFMYAWMFGAHCGLRCRRRRVHRISTPRNNVHTSHKTVLSYCLRYSIMSYVCLIFCVLFRGVKVIQRGSPPSPPRPPPPPPPPPHPSSSRLRKRRIRRGSNGVKRGQKGVKRVKGGQNAALRSSSVNILTLNKTRIVTYIWGFLYVAYCISHEGGERASSAGKSFISAMHVL